MTKNISDGSILHNAKLLTKELESVEDYGRKQLQAYIDKDEAKFNFDLEDFEDVEEAADALFECLQEDISDLIADYLMDEDQETAEEVFMEAVSVKFPFETSADWLKDLHYAGLENSG